MPAWGIPIFTQILSTCLQWDLFAISQNNYTRDNMNTKILAKILKAIANQSDWL